MSKRCKNDPTRFYKGTEPSPKGNGYCAHSFEAGTIMKGKDSQYWVVVQVGKKKKIKRWVKQKYELNLKLCGIEQSEFRTKIKKYPLVNSRWDPNRSYNIFFKFHKINDFDKFVTQLVNFLKNTKGVCIFDYIVLDQVSIFTERFPRLDKHICRSKSKSRKKLFGLF